MLLNALVRLLRDSRFLLLLSAPLLQILRRHFLPLMFLLFGGVLFLQLHGGEVVLNCGIFSGLD